jgi:adenylate kinase
MLVSTQQLNAANALLQSSSAKLAFVNRPKMGVQETSCSSSVRMTEKTVALSSMVATLHDELETNILSEVDVNVMKNVVPLRKAQIQHIKLSASINSPPRKIIIMGGPASGKGTVSEYVASKYNLVHLSTGDMLRDVVARQNNSEIDQLSDPAMEHIAQVAHDYMNRGQLVPDEVVIDMVQHRLSQPDVQERGYILDGFPRTARQAGALFDAGIVPELVLCLTVPDSELIKRVTGRRIDPVTRKVYDIAHKSASSEVVASRLIQRSDDTEEKIVRRLGQLHQNEEEVKKLYSEFMIEIDASSSPGDVVRLVDQLTSGVAF